MSRSDLHATWARYYDEVNQRCFGAAYDRLTEQTLSLVSELPDVARIVDIGAGTGRLALPLAVRGYAVTAVEPSGPMLEQLAAKDADDRVTKQHQSMAGFTTDHPCDLAIAVFTVLAYVLTPRELTASLANVASALRPGGLFLLDVPGRVLFQDRHVEVKGLSRRTQCIATTRSRFRYQETTRIETPVGDVQYDDACELRYWKPREVQSALLRCGFEAHQDVTSRFPMAGANYWIVRRR